MALQLFKLAGAVPAIETTQDVHQYFYTFTDSAYVISAGQSYTLAVANWVISDGGTTDAFVTDAASNSLFIQGVLQQPGIYVISSASVNIVASSAISLDANTPITLQTYNASASMSTTTTFAIP
ncbi:MAG: hypothetical protein AB7D36_02210 [Oscillospiraceae bacterium]